MSDYGIHTIHRLTAVAAIASMIMIGGGCATKKTVVKADGQPVKEAQAVVTKADRPVTPGVGPGVEVAEPIRAGDKPQPVVVQGMQGDRITVSGLGPDAKAEPRPTVQPGTTTVTENIAEPAGAVVAAASAPASTPASAMATPPAAIAAQPAQTASQSQQPSLPITPQSPAPAPDTASKTAAATTSRNGFSDIHFDYDRYDIRPDEKPVLGKVVDWLMNNPKSRLTIEGHCDERGTNEYNLALGERRASAAMKFLTAMGIDKGRTATVSYGEERPVDTGHNEEAWAMNRRAHFVAEN